MKCNTVKSVFQSYKKFSDFVTQNNYCEKIFVTFYGKNTISVVHSETKTEITSDSVKAFFRRGLKTKRAFRLK